MRLRQRHRVRQHDGGARRDALVRGQRRRERRPVDDGGAGRRLDQRGGPGRGRQRRSDREAQGRADGRLPSRGGHRGAGGVGGDGARARGQGRAQAVGARRRRGTLHRTGRRRHVGAGRRGTRGHGSAQGRRDRRRGSASESGSVTACCLVSGIGEQVREHRAGEGAGSLDLGVVEVGDRGLPRGEACEVLVAAGDLVLEQHDALDRAAAARGGDLDRQVLDAQRDAGGRLGERRGADGDVPCTVAAAEGGGVGGLRDCRPRGVGELGVGDLGVGELGGGELGVGGGLLRDGVRRHRALHGTRDRRHHEVRQVRRAGGRDVSEPLLELATERVDEGGACTGLGLHVTQDRYHTGRERGDPRCVAHPEPSDVTFRAGGERRVTASGATPRSRRACAVPRARRRRRWPRSRAAGPPRGAPGTRARRRTPRRGRRSSTGRRR